MCVPVFDTSVGAARRRDRHTPIERTQRTKRSQEQRRRRKSGGALNRLRRPDYSSPRRPLHSLQQFLFSSLRSVYGTFGAFAIVSGEASPKYTPSCQTLKSPATKSRISRSSVPSIRHITSLPSISLSINLYSPFE